MIGLRAQAGLFFVEPDPRFTFSAGPIIEALPDFPKMGITYHGLIDLDWSKPI